jgi:SAM-dependent methyltransferase
LKAEWFKEVESVRSFDLNDGDAQNISHYVKEQFDFVYSSNCLEHLERPLEALNEWWNLVKLGGHLVVIVPDEDLYEQGIWPSRWNGGHKWTFTVWKQKSWSPKSINVAELCQNLPDSRLVQIRMADFGWDKTLRGLDQTVPIDGAEAFIELVVKKEKTAMQTIGELATLYTHTDKRKLGYSAFYDTQLAPLRFSVRKILEIGIDSGDSLRIWRDFFPNAIIHGWDSVPGCCFQEPRIITQVVNHDNKEQVRAALEAMGGNIDLIIDDGSHRMDSQQRLLAWCLPYVAIGGLYVTEDLHTSMVPDQFGLAEDQSNSTYRMYVGLQSTGVVESEYMTAEEKAYIQRVTGNVLLVGFPAIDSPPFQSYILAALVKK